MTLRLGRKWLTDKFAGKSQNILKWKPQEWKIFKELREGYNDHYFHHNNYMKSLLIYILRYEYGKLIKMDYIDYWEYSLKEHTVSLTRKFEDEEVCVSFDIFKNCERIFLNCDEPQYYERYEQGKLCFFSQNIICIPEVNITFSKPCCKICLVVDYVSNDVPSTLKPAFKQETDYLPYLMSDQLGNPMVEISSIALFNSSNNLIFRHGKNTIVPGISEFWIEYLEAREINEAFFRSVLNIAYRVDMDEYIEFLQHFIRYFPYKRDYEFFNKDVENKEATH